MEVLIFAVLIFAVLTFAVLKAPVIPFPSIAQRKERDDWRFQQSL
jgi:hypothetical protein